MGQNKKTQKQKRKELKRKLKILRIEVLYGDHSVDEKVLNKAEDNLLCQEIEAAHLILATAVVDPQKSSSMSASEETGPNDGTNAHNRSVLAEIYTGEDSAKWGCAGLSEKGYGGNFAKL